MCQNILKLSEHNTNNSETLQFPFPSNDSKLFLKRKCVEPTLPKRRNYANDMRAREKAWL